MRQPLDHLVNCFGSACFHCGKIGHWRANCSNTRGLSNSGPELIFPTPFGGARPRTPEEKAQPSHCFHCKRVLKVDVVEYQVADKVLLDRITSIHLSGSFHFATKMRSIEPFRIFLSELSSSNLVSQMTTLKILIKGGDFILHNVSYSEKISGTILSLGWVC
ncbi:hypothetical protein O181_016848 [Austropuccinia psidii MF-1]|uniref:CCHC-type domain-containing protein n=1 Tax=Austropuccinia psidii MF-1 TaxID=1389203 RepID=A0A9Q3C612_9BASI|nr:hypothetical protein [Austropuccinia psidii MF-1]